MPPPPANRSGESSSVRQTRQSAPKAETPRTPTSGDDEVNDDAPTIISTNQGRSSSAESYLGKSLAGRKLGPFELIEPIGVGGMAAVIRARDLVLGRTVALKILPPEMAVDPENITRFRQEARAAAKLDHENIARVYHFGEDQGLHYIAFEFVEGTNLRLMMEQRGPLPVDQCIHYMLQVAAGLAHANSRGVIHRDIKPSNILITPDGKAKIVDMGLARQLDPHLDGGLTQSGVTLGTFDYISPEQALEPREADIRADIYSLGCTFYHLMTGHPPVPEGTAAKKLHYHQHVAPLDPRQLNPNIPDDVTAVLARMMAKDADQRYQTPEQLIKHLLHLARERNMPAESLPVEMPSSDSGFSESPLPKPPRLSPLLIGVAITVLLIVVILGGFNGTSDRSLEPEVPWDLGSVATEPGIPEPVTPKDPEIEPEPGPLPMNDQKRFARNTEELIALLHQSVPAILLAPETVYDLTDLDRSTTALFEGKELILRAEDSSKPPIIRLGYAPPDDGVTSRPGALTLRGSGSVTLRDIRFEIIPPPVETTTRPSPLLTAISARGLKRLTVQDCEFRAESTGLIGTSVLTLIPEEITTPQADLIQCYFSPGVVGVRTIGSSTISATDCAFAPHNAIFQTQAPTNTLTERATNPTELSLTLTRCSMMLDGGAAVEVGPRTSVEVLAGHCLFSDPFVESRLTDSLRGFPVVNRFLPPQAQAVVLRQLDPQADLDVISYSGLTYTYPDSPRLERAMANGYHQVAPLGRGSEVLTFEQCEDEDLPIADAAARILTESPWKEEDLSELLVENPQKAFSLPEDERMLRVEFPPDVVKSGGEGKLGVLYFLGTAMYLLPLSSVPGSGPPPDHHIIWEPNFPKGSSRPTGVETSLQAAIVQAEPGDVILIRENGLLPILPITVNEAKNLTIKPDEGYRPTLTFAEANRADATLFKLFDGRLTFEGLQFDLRPVNPRQEISRGIVSIAGAGQCIFRDCAVTMSEANDVDLYAILLDDPTGQMKPNENGDPPRPAIVLENTWLRGKGDLLWVKPSRPFDLTVTNGLIALDGTFLDVEPVEKPNLPSTQEATITLTHVTTCLTEHLIHLLAREDMETGTGLVPIRMYVTGSAFAPVGPSSLAFVRVDRLASEMELRQKGLLSWDDARDNIYGYSDQHVMLRVQPAESGAMPQKPYGVNEWLEFTLEEGRPFTRIRFAVPPVESQPLTSVRPEDFRIRAFDPEPTPALKPAEVGADIDQLPRPFSDRDEEPFVGE